MNTDDIQREILGLENQYWEAMKSKDVDAAIKLTRFPCIVTSPKGAMRVEEDQYRKMMQSQTGDQYSDVEINDPKVDLFNDKTAVITYSTNINSMKRLDVSTWVLEGKTWKCAFHSETPIQ